MPDYVKRAIWLHGVARRLDDEALAALLETYADKLIRKAGCDAAPTALRIARPESSARGDRHEHIICGR